MNLKKLARSAVATVKRNPGAVLAVAGLVAPKLTGKLVAKVAPVIVAVGKREA